MMLSNKLFVIKEGYFNLPDDFEGTCGEALVLMSKYRLEQEAKEKINRDDDVDDKYKYFISNENIKCSLSYGLCKLNEDKTEWEAL